jgi:AcrR family transcriptional regulator
MPEAAALPAEIIHHAAALFREKGYDETTLNDVALAADITLAALEQMVPHKLLLALAVYRQMTVRLVDVSSTIPAGTLAERYGHLLDVRLVQYQHDQDAVGVLFASLMRRNSPLQPTDLSAGKKDPLYQVFERVVQDATDAPSSAQDSDDLKMLLYSFHFVVTIFWLYDRTPNQQATTLLIDFLRDVFKFIRPMMIMPLFGKAMVKLAQIMMLVFGGARLVSP